MATASKYLTLNRPSYRSLKDTLTVKRAALTKDASGGNVAGAESTILSAPGVHTSASRGLAQVEVIATLHGERAKAEAWMLNASAVVIKPEDILVDADSKRWVVSESHQLGNLTKLGLREES